MKFYVVNIESGQIVSEHDTMQEAFARVRSGQEAISAANWEKTYNWMRVS